MSITSFKDLTAIIFIHDINFASSTLSFGIKKSVKPSSFHFINIDIIPSTGFNSPSRPSSQTNIDLSIIFLSILSNINQSIQIAIGKSYLFQDFFIFDGERFTINFLFGNFIPKCVKADLILSFDSFILVSASQTISIVGNALFELVSTVIKNPSIQRLLIV